MPVRTLKKNYWNLRHELKRLALWWIGEFPVGPGEWFRAHSLGWFLAGFGKDNTIQHGFRIFTPECVRIGSNCVFAQGVFITGGGGVTIGDWVGIGPDVKIWSVNHRFEDPDTPFIQQGSSKKPVTIEDDVWLAANVMVLPGVTVGKGAVVSACAVVTRDVPAYSIVAGNPARVIGWRKPEEKSSSILGAPVAQ
jgi:maltose O-acetyltransferase